MDPSMKTTAKHALLWAFTVSAVLLLTLALLFRLGPRVEGKLYPVLGNVKGTIIKTGPEFTDVLVTGDKLRSCKLIAIKAEVKLDGHWVPGLATMIKNDGTELAIPNQRQVGGTPMVRTLRVYPASDDISITVLDECHALWLLPQHILTVHRNLMYPGKS